MSKSFVSSAKKYCLWAEESASPPKEEAKKAIHLLVTLYSSALTLQDEGYGKDVNAKEVSDEEWRIIFKRFSSLPFNYYSEFFNPHNLEEKPMMGDLADDLSDIYRDIKNGLWLYENGHKIQAIWAWKQGFKIHWGRHAACALHALHCYIDDESIEL